MFVLLCEGIKRVHPVNNVSVKYMLITVIWLFSARVQAKNLDATATRTRPAIDNIRPTTYIAIDLPSLALNER